MTIFVTSVIQLAFKPPAAALVDWFAMIGHNHAGPGGRCEPAHPNQEGE